MVYDDFGYEVDFLPIGDASKSGDAICIRWGRNISNRCDQQFVMVVDGGHAYCADAVVAHIKKYYYGSENASKDQTVINALINTHPHSDHFGGIPKIYEQTAVKSVAMHLPWEHAGLPKWFRDGRVTASGIKDQLREGLEAAFDFSKAVRRDGVPICELYGGMSYDLLYGVKMAVLGPGKVFYDSLLPDFNAIPTKGNGIGTDRLELTGKDVPAMLGRLSDDGDTSAENLSGLIFALTMPTGDVLLFTGDAGIESLMFAISHADEYGVDLSKLSFFQVPHHGSVQNLGPSVIRMIFGKPGSFNQSKSVTAYISVASNPDDSHPSRRVINALRAANCNVYKTQGVGLQHYRGTARLHPGWITLSPLPGYDMVEG